ncbi:ADP-ribosylation factor-like protein 13B [Boothiomyces sp. JEL0866]|nr:ADP-ribosylation factor-like protein 13B [Boothiomyces sp. JEL0866]
MKSGYSVSVLGLDDAGKTTLILRMKGGNIYFILDMKSNPPRAKWGFTSTTIKLTSKQFLPFCIPIPIKKDVWLTFYDVGGDAKIRSIWPNYYADVYASIFVVDTSAPHRFEEAKMELHNMAKSPLMAGKPILILGNKGTLSVKELTKILDISQLCMESMEKSKATLISVKVCDLNSSSGGTVKEGVDWVIRGIESNFKSLKVKVESDTKIQKERWKQEQNEKLQKLEQNNPTSNKVYPMDE